MPIMKYTQSKYNIWVDEYPDRNSALVFNSLRRCLLKLPVTLTNKIRTGDYSKIPNKILRFLVESSVLVECEVDEIKILRNWFDGYRLQTKTLAITLPVTYKCNCQCVYCYEDGIRSEESIATPKSEIEIQHLLNWVEKLIGIWNPETLDFCFHGGEPLVVSNTIQKIVKGVNYITEKHKVKKDFSIVTNGVLLNKRNIQMLHRNSITRVMTTLDGMPKDHDMRRKLVSGKGTFFTVFKNMLLALEEGITLTLNVNVDKSNYAGVETLLDFLVKNGVNKFKKFTIVFSVIKEGPESHNKEHFSKHQFNAKEEGRAFATLYKAALKRKIRIVDPIGMGFCSFKVMSNFIVDMFGEIYKCVTLVGHQSSRVGNINDSVNSVLRKSSQHLYTISWENKRKCKKCVYLPICLGGCAQQALLKKGSLDKVFCMKPYLDSYMMDAIKLKYDRAIIFPDIMKKSSFNSDELLRL